MMKHLRNKAGFTLVEMILSCAIISIFMLGSAAVLGSAAKGYIQETRSSGARGAMETVCDDIKNYIMSGRDVRLMFYMNGSRNRIYVGEMLPGGKDYVDVVEPGTGATFEKGTFFYTDGKYVKPDGTEGKVSLTSDQIGAMNSVAEGIDLGYKMIYLTEEGTYIQGLPYAKDFYRGMTMTLEIKEEKAPINAFFVDESGGAAVRKKNQKLYKIKLTGRGEGDIYSITTNTAVAGMNDLEFN